MDINRKTIWLVSPYHTGSHQAWANAYARHSRHQIRLLTMTGNFWKWRMQGGAMALAQLARQYLAEEGPPDAILSTDMVNAPAWLGLLRRHLSATTPLLHYMHENQLTYPWPPGEKPDLNYALINWLSQLAADQVAFNSQYHADAWFTALPRLLKHFPDYNHLELIDLVRRKSMILPVGIECARIMPQTAQTAPASDSPPLIVWNQRWEYDKRPDRFFQLLYRLQDTGVGFQLVVAGENQRKMPAEFDEAQHRLAGAIVHWGYVASYADYVQWLRRASLVISTAEHEFFGISILEAIIAGAFPLLPRRLSYPELIPQPLHPACLYETEDELFQKAAHRLQQPRPAPPSLRAHIMEVYDWPKVAERYDAAVEEMTR